MVVVLIAARYRRLSKSGLKDSFNRFSESTPSERWSFLFLFGNKEKISYICPQKRLKIFK